MIIEYALFDHDKIRDEQYTLTPTTTVLQWPEIGHFTQSGLRKISKYLRQIKGMEKVTIATTPSKLLQIGKYPIGNDFEYRITLPEKAINERPATACTYSTPYEELSVEERATMRSILNFTLFLFSRGNNLYDVVSDDIITELGITELPPMNAKGLYYHVDYEKSKIRAM